MKGRTARTRRVRQGTGVVERPGAFQIGKGGVYLIAGAKMRCDLLCHHVLFTPAVILSRGKEIM